MNDQNPLLSRRESKKKKTQTLLLDAARQLFAEKGVAGTTIDEIADRADVARGTFFNYFPNKDAVLQALWLAQLEKLDLTIRQQLSMKLSTGDRILNLFQAFALAAAEHGAYLRAVTSELERDGNTLELSRHRTECFHETLTPLIDAGRAQGDVRTDYAGPFLTQIVGAVYLSIVHHWRLYPDYDLSSHIKDAARFLAGAIGPAP